MHWSVLAVDGDLTLESRKLLAADRHSPNYIYLVNLRMQPHFFFTALLRLWLELKCYSYQALNKICLKAL